MFRRINRNATMSESDPAIHQKLERQFMAHVEQLLRDDRLRLETTRGRKGVANLIIDTKKQDRAVELKRQMAEMNKFDRDLESHMPVGSICDVAISRRSMWVFKSLVGSLRVISIPPTRALLAG